MPKKQIHESEAQFRKLVMHAPVAMGIFREPHHVMVFANEKMLAFLDKTPEQILNKPYFEANPEVKGQGFEKILDDVYNTGIRFVAEEMEVNLLRFGKMGKLYVKLIYEALREEDGTITGLIVVVTEITEQVNARKQVEASEKRLNNVLSQSLLAIAILKGEDLIIDFANESMKTEWGKGSDVLGKPFLELLPEVKDQEIPTLLQKVYATGVAHHEVEMKVLMVRNGKPEEVYFTLIYQPYKDVDNTVTGVTIFCNEVTEQVNARKQVEASAERFEFLVNAQPQKLWISDDKGDVNYFNKQWLDYTKKDFEQLKAIKAKAIIHPEDWEKSKNAWLHSLATGDDCIREHRILGHDGTYRWHKGISTAYKDENGKITMWIGTNTDIHEQKELVTSIALTSLKAEEAKNSAEAATKVAESAVKAKQQFLSNMSHEIRTPMNAIIGFTKVLLKTDLSVRQKEYLTAIKFSGDALIVLINDILDLAKVDAGKMTFEQTPFRMELSITAMLHLFETKILEKNLELVQFFDPRIPKVLVGDPVRLHQIMLNLMSNAIKFTSEGKITVMVLLLNEDTESINIEFSVTDTGIGISEEKIGAIFENFQQATSETSRIYGGTGLGLAIVKQLVESQGGTISVKSKVGEGSTFSFTLNFLKTENEAQAITEILELDKDIKDIKVLVVEDMALNQLLMRTLLDDFGFEHDIAANGKIAIEKLLTNVYDIILMDLQMPEMNGFEATDYIRNVMNLTLPIIALTADVTTVDVAKCKAIGMDDYIAKPIDERVLYTKIVGFVKNTQLDEKQKEKKNNEIKQAKCIDLGYLLQRTKANPALMMEMISLYLEQTPPLIKAMKQSLLNHDWKTLRGAVHKMIPSFSIMGINLHFEIMAKKIQEYATAQQETEGIADLVLQLENICTQACKELEEEFNKIKNTKI